MLLVIGKIWRKSLIKFLVPRHSALLIGSKLIVIKETAHGEAFGKDWYGSKNKVEEWLNRTSE